MTSSTSSTFSSRRWIWQALALLLLVVVATGLWFWLSGQRIPNPGDSLYERYAEQFEIGTAALDTRQLFAEAEKHLSEAIRLVPSEPAALTNRALLYMLTSRRALAATDLARAARLAPNNADIEEHLARFDQQGGQLDSALVHARKALEQTPDHFRRLGLLDELLEAQNAPDAEAARLALNEKMLVLRPTGLPILTTRLTLAVRLKKDDVRKDTMDRLNRLAPTWRHALSLAQLREVEKAIADQLQTAEIVQEVLKLDNVLKQEQGYTRLRTEMRPIDQAGASLQNFLRMAPLRSLPDEPDTDLSLVESAAVRLSSKEGEWVGPVWLTRDASPIVGVCGAKSLHVGEDTLPFPAGSKGLPPSLSGVLCADIDNDLRNDFVLAGAGGLRFYRQSPADKFDDVTSKTKLPKEFLDGDYFGAWAADIEMDGDLDIIVALRAGGMKLLRNNSDGTFTAQDIFPGVVAATAFVWADLDNDGAPDAAMLDGAGKLHVFFNERAGVFRAAKHAPEPRVAFAGLTVAALGDSENFQLIALGQDGPLLALTIPDQQEPWRVAELGKVDATRGLTLTPTQCQLSAIDLDSNGAIDLVARTKTGGVVWLSEPGGALMLSPLAIPPGLSSPFPDGQGSLVLVGQSNGQQVLSAVQGTKAYTSRELHFRHDPGSLKESADQHLNSFAIGSEMEVRAGSLILKRPIDRPAIHIGLGRRKKIAVTRAVWTNGSAAYEINNPETAKVLVVQRLTGSCPFLFTHDGEKMVFVTDFCWSTPLGLYINGQPGVAFTQTTEWLKISGEKLRPREGKYDVRVNANLWETHYLDQLALKVVDHPPDTELHLDERFFLTTTEPRLYLTNTSRPVANAIDQDGKDVTDVIKDNDGRYLDTFGLGRFQGVTRDHWVTLELGDVPGNGPMYVLAHGWLQPTDSSINKAIEQSSHPRPQPLTLEVFDGGDWKQVGPPLGFPAGKNKTMVIAIPEGTRQVRLRTNLEIYWDSLRVARGLDESKCVVKTLSPTTAELRFRGIVRMDRVNRSSPELPHYDDIVATGQAWRDLIGYHTRFGDVRELIEKIDDRYVMMNAGDELGMTFTVPEVPEVNWRRDFVWVSDGWTKDGNLNTKFGNTVLPLPYHGMKDYDTPPGRLEDDPVYRRHRKDWETYHTRYVTPTAFGRGLRHGR